MMDRVKIGRPGRRFAFVVVGAIALIVVVLFAVGWYYASLLKNDGLEPDYSPEELNLVVVSVEGDQIILNVRDNGPGIPAADQAHIFDKFYRGSNISEQITGSGLGLAIVKTIVDNHQGRIWVESAEGRGSSFFIVLPVSAEPVQVMKKTK